MEVNSAAPVLEVEILNLHARLGLLLCNLLIIIFAICGNALAVIIVVKSSKTSTPTKMCLVSLCVSDLLMTGLSATTDIDEIMDCFHSWDFGALACTALPILEFLFIMANALSLLTMAVQRYWSVNSLIKSKARNLAERASLLASSVALVFVWTIPLCFSIPCIGSYQLNVYNCSWFPVENLSNDSLGLPPPPSVHWKKYSTTVEEDEYSVTILCRPLPVEVEFNSEVDYCHLRDGKQDIGAKIGICDATGAGDAELVYMSAIGVVYGLLIISFFFGFYFIEAARKAEVALEQLVPPKSLSNIELMGKIRIVLSNQKRGVRVIMIMIGLYLVCRIPFWLFLLSGQTDIYVSRSSSNLGWFFALHALGGLKSVLTAYIYAHSNKAFQSNDQYHYMGRSSNQACVLPWRRHKVSNFVVNESI